MTAFTSQFDRRAKTAFVVACVVLLASGFGFDLAVKAFNVHLRKAAVDLRGSFDTIPKSIGRWRATGEDRNMDEAMLEELGTRIYLDRFYSRDGDRSSAINVHLAYYTGMIDTVPHVPDRCFVAAGFNLKTQPTHLTLPIDVASWRVDEQHKNLATDEQYRFGEVADFFTGKTERVRMPVGDFEVRTTEFESPDQPHLRIFSGYFFIANGRVAVAPWDVKMIAFDPSERFAYYCKVQFTYASADATPEKFQDLVSEFLNGFLPELMRRLPDWSEVERRGEGETTAGPSSS